MKKTSKLHFYRGPVPNERPEPIPAGAFRSDRCGPCRPQSSGSRCTSDHDTQCLQNIIGPRSCASSRIRLHLHSRKTVMIGKITTLTGIFEPYHTTDTCIPRYGQTVFGDHLICMEDGLSMKMLKRHLLTVHGITPDEYRAKWGLPESYPMVAADYARLRSTLARESGLGLKPDDRPSKARRRSRGS